MDSPDEVLMGRTQDGDEDAFRVLLERHESRVLAFFSRRSGDGALAEDLALEIWHKIYQARATYRPEAKFTTFLYRVAKNHWIDHIRVHANRPRKTLSLDQSAGGDSGAEDGARLGDFIGSSDAPPDAAEVNRELAAKIREGLGRLNEGEMSVFQLAVYDEMKYADIGEILDIPVGTVKSRMHTSMRKLRDWLEKEGLTP